MEDVKMKRVDPMDNMVESLTKPFSQLKTKVHLEKMRLRFVGNWL